MARKPADDEALNGTARTVVTRPGAGLSAVEAIKAYILERGLAPGDPLPTEAELCSSLGVSRSSVREAIRTLVSLDIVDVRHGHGTTVGGLSLAPFVNGLVFRSLLNPGGGLTTLREVVELRQGIDLLAAEPLVENYRGQDTAELQALVDQMRAESADGSPFLETDRAFHELLLRQAGNDLVRQLVGALWEVHTVVVPQLGIPEPDDIRTTVDAHGAMLAAVVAGDVAAYRAAVLTHYAPLRRVLEQSR